MTPQVEFLVRALELLSEQLCSEGRTVGSSLINDAITVLKRDAAATVSAPAATPAPTPQWTPEHVAVLIAKLDTKHVDDITPPEAYDARKWPIQALTVREVLRLEQMLKSLLPAAPVAGTRPEKEE